MSIPNPAEAPAPDAAPLSQKQKLGLVSHYHGLAYKMLDQALDLRNKTDSHAGMMLRRATGAVAGRAWNAYQQCRDDASTPDAFRNFVLHTDDEALIRRRDGVREDGSRGARENVKPLRTEAVATDIRGLIATIATLETLLECDPSIGGNLPTRERDKVDEPELAKQATPPATTLPATTLPAALLALPEDAATLRPEAPEPLDAPAETPPSPYKSDELYTRENVMKCVRGLVLSLRLSAEQAQATTQPDKLLQEPYNDLTIPREGKQKRNNTSDMRNDVTVMMSFALGNDMAKEDFVALHKVRKEETDLLNERIKGAPKEALYKGTKQLVYGELASGLNHVMRRYVGGLKNYVNYKVPAAPGQAVTSIHPPEELNAGPGGGAVDRLKRSGDFGIV